MVQGAVSDRLFQECRSDSLRADAKLTIELGRIIADVHSVVVFIELLILFRLVRLWMRRLGAAVAQEVGSDQCAGLRGIERGDGAKGAHARSSDRTRRLADQAQTRIVRCGLDRRGRFLSQMSLSRERLI